MRKNICMLLVIALAAALCGCNSDIPDLTEEQTALISEYATNLLVKHSVLSERNLLSQPELEQGIIQEEEDRILRIKADEIAQAYLNADIEPVEDAEPDDAQESGENAIKEEVEPIKTIAEFLEEDGFTIDYSSYELCESYPATGADELYMAMDASDGHQLCIVKFNVQNITTSEQDFDMLGKKSRFALRTDGGETISAQATMLLNDLSSYRGTIAGNTTEQMVLVFEVRDGITQMESTKLVIKTDAGENVVSLY